MNLYFEAFKTFSRIGLFTLGGGYAMIPMIEHEVVEHHGWIDRDEFLDLLAIAQTCPGVFAVNMSIFIGYKLRGVRGSVVTALGTILPSFFIILSIALFFQQFQDNPTVASIFRGIRPAVVALIAAPCWKMGRQAKLNRYNLWIPVVCALLIWGLGVSPIIIVLASGLGGFLYGHYLKTDDSGDDEDDRMTILEIKMKKLMEDK